MELDWNKRRLLIANAEYAVQMSFYLATQKKMVASGSKSIIMLQLIQNCANVFAALVSGHKHSKFTRFHKREREMGKMRDHFACRHADHGLWKSEWRSVCVAP